MADDAHAPVASAEPQANAAAGDLSGGAAAASSPHAAPGGHHDSRDFYKPPLYFSLQLFVFTLLLFGSYFFVMKKSAWQPLIDGFNEREARVARAERDAAKAKSEAARFHEQAEKRMVEAHGQVKEILTKARSEAEAEKMKIVKEAELQATRVKEQALADIAAARSQAVQELSSLVDAQARVASSRIAGRSFN